MITIRKDDSKNQVQIKFAWMTFPKTWLYDLKLKLYFKIDSNSYKLLNKVPLIVSSSDPSQTLSVSMDEFQSFQTESKSESKSELKSELESKEDTKQKGIKIFRQNGILIDYLPKLKSYIKIFKFY